MHPRRLRSGSPQPRDAARGELDRRRLMPLAALLGRARLRLTGRARVERDASAKAEAVDRDAGGERLGDAEAEERRSTMPVASGVKRRQPCQSPRPQRGDPRRRGTRSPISRMPSPKIGPDDHGAGVVRAGRADRDRGELADEEHGGAGERQRSGRGAAARLGPATPAAARSRADRGRRARAESAYSDRDGDERAARPGIAPAGRRGRCVAGWTTPWTTMPPTRGRRARRRCRRCVQRRSEVSHASPV